MIVQMQREQETFPVHLQAERVQLHVIQINQRIRFLELQSLVHKSYNDGQEASLTAHPNTIIITQEELSIAITSSTSQHCVPRIKVVGTDAVVLREFGAVVSTLCDLILVAIGRDARLRW